MIEYDIENDCIIRDANGFAKQCPHGHPGLLIAPIISWDPVRRYSGYYKKPTTAENNNVQKVVDNEKKHTTEHNNNNTNHHNGDGKVLTNLFKNGDKYFNTGDILAIGMFLDFRHVKN